MVEPPVFLHSKPLIQLALVAKVVRRSALRSHLHHEIGDLANLPYQVVRHFAIANIHRIHAEGDEEVRSDAPVAVGFVVEYEPSAGGKHIRAVFVHLIQDTYHSIQGWELQHTVLRFRLVVEYIRVLAKPILGIRLGACLSRRHLEPPTSPADFFSIIAS